MSSRRQPSFRLWLLVGVAALVLGTPSFAAFYVDWLWFGELGYQQVFLRKLTASSSFGAAVFTIAFVVLYTNWLIALSSVRTPYVVLGPAGGGMRPPVLQRQQLR